MKVLFVAGAWVRIGPSRHFGATQQFSRFRGEADIGGRVPIAEPRLAGWAIDHLTEANIEHGRHIMAKIDKTSNPLHRLRLATEFHTIIYARANRPFFLEQVNRARNNLNRYWRLAWGDQTFPVSTQNEHQKILDLCVARDRAGLTSFIEQHIMTSGEVVLRYLHSTCNRRSIRQKPSCRKECRLSGHERDG